MNGGLIALIIAGLGSFLIGVYLASTGERTMGIALMAMGLAFQVLSLVRLKAIRNAGDRGDM